MFIQRLNLRPDQFHFITVNKNRLRILVNDLQIHKQIIKYLEEVERGAFFFHTPTEEKPLNFLIKNLTDNSYNKEDIEEALLSDLKLELNIIKIKRFETLRSKLDKTVLNIWHIQIHPQSKHLKEFINLKYILNTTIKIEQLKPQSIQCKNCQRYYHTARNCRMPFRCVKCVQSHAPGECPIVPVTDPENPDLNRLQCVNCLQRGHPASYKGCPKAKDIQTRNKNNITAQKQNHTNRNSTMSNLPNRPTFAECVKTVQPPKNNAVGKQNWPQNHGTNNPQSDNLNFLDRELKKYFNQDFNSITNKINTFIQTYNTLSEKNKKDSLLRFMFTVSNDFNSL